MRLRVTLLFVLCPAVGAAMGIISALARTVPRNETFFGDVSFIERLLSPIFGAIAGAVLGFLVALLVWAIVLAISDAQRYDELGQQLNGRVRCPKAIYVLRWPVVVLASVIMARYAGMQGLHVETRRISQPIASPLPTPSPTLAAVLPDQQPEVRRAQFEVPALLGDWYYPNAQIWPCSQPRPQIAHSMVMLLSKDGLSTVIAYYERRIPSLNGSNVPARFEGRAARPGDGRDTWVSVRQQGDSVLIQFTST